jgi:hypothetical protein
VEYRRSWLTDPRRSTGPRGTDADDYRAPTPPARSGRRDDRLAHPGIELHVLGEIDGRDILELGCGAARWSTALAVAGARPVGFDVRPPARPCAPADDRGRLRLPAAPRSAEAVPLPRPELRHRLLRPRGDVVADRPDGPGPPGSTAACWVQPFAAILDLAWADDAERAGTTFVRDYVGLHRLAASEEVAFQLPYGEWIRLFRVNGFEILDLLEPRPGPDATSSYRDDVERDWSRRWPSESIWRVRRTA